MAKNQTVRIRPSVLQEDRDAYAALAAIPDYKPANVDFEAAKVLAARTTMVEKRDSEAEKQAECDTARDIAAAAEWAFHNMILGAKDQVKAQYGEDSNELQALGLKKKSEYKSPHPKAARATP